MVITLNIEDYQLLSCNSLSVNIPTYPCLPHLHLRYKAVHVDVTVLPQLPRKLRGQTRVRGWWEVT